ncbi:MAG: flagellar hook-basal body complex protein FliE [Phycisphaerae bacterium]
MADPISINGLRPVAPTGLPGTAKRSGPATTAGEDFAAMVKEQLLKVSQMQSEADENIQKLLTGETQNLTEVFTAARKAEVAFSLLMEIRNKLVNAYEEIKNMRV